jgi:hypothetical protein
MAGRRGNPLTSGVDQPRVTQRQAVDRVPSMGSSSFRRPAAAAGNDIDSPQLRWLTKMVNQGRGDERWVSTDDSTEKTGKGVSRNGLAIKTPLTMAVGDIDQSLPNWLR